MSEFVLIYYNDPEKMPSSPEEGAKHMAKFQEWIAGVGDAMVNPGTPFGPSKMVTSSGVSDPGPNRPSGFSVIKADSFDAALEITQGCPYFDFGTIEVAEMKQME